MSSRAPEPDADFDGKDIDLVLVTGAGASTAFGVGGKRLPLMADWSHDLVERLAQRGGGFLKVTGLDPGMDGPAFEDRLGRFLRGVESFKTIEPLLEPMTELPGGSRQLVAPGGWEEWHHQGVFSLEQIVGVIHESLYELFASPSYDPRAARAAYGALLANLAVSDASRIVVATTNYDTIAEETLVDLGRMPDTGDFQRSPFNAERVIRVNRLLDGMPRYTPVLHLHGRVGWFRRPDGDVVSVPGQTYSTASGLPIAMLPDLEKDYETDPIISQLWAQFAGALRRAKLVLVLGHSLHDEALVQTLAQNVLQPTRLAVTVLPSSHNPAQADEPEGRALHDMLRERLPRARELLVRFDGDLEAGTDTQLAQWSAWARNQ